MRPSAFAPACETRIRLLRFWKSYTPSGDEKRAVREVGDQRRYTHLAERLRDDL